jgi:phosphoglycolate phosphatase
MLRKIKLEFSLQNPVYVGDTEGDELAANLAGIEYIHVTYGFGTSTDNALKFNSFSALQYYFEG